MIARHEVLLSLYGAWRLFLRDPRGIEWMDDSIEGYWKSFSCALVVLPIYAVWIGVRSSGLEDVSFIRIVTVEGIEYVIQWVAWPLIMAYLAPAIGRDDQYLRYIVAFNWSHGVYVAILFIVLTAELFGLASGGAAAGFVAGEFVLMHIIDAVAQNLLR